MAGGSRSHNVLVTGGAGYIGSHACKALAAAGYTPITLDNLVHGHREAVRWGPLIEADLSDAASVRRALCDYEIGAVLHFAGFAYVGESVLQPDKYFHNNFSNSVTLVDAMRREKVDCIVFSSTCATYGVPTRMPIDEDHPQNPVNPYGESKLFVERMLESCRVARGLRYAALRYFNAAGADVDGELGEMHDPETHLIPLVIDAALGRRPDVSIFGTDYATRDGTAIRDYIHVTDLADAHVLALQQLQAGETQLRLNLGTGKGHTVREVIHAVEAAGERTVPVREVGRRAGDPPELVAACAKARSVLGWEPRYSELRDIIESAWRWHARQVAQATIAADA